MIEYTNEKIKFFAEKHGFWGHDVWWIQYIPRFKNLLKDWIDTHTWVCDCGIENIDRDDCQFCGHKKP